MKYALFIAEKRSNPSAEEEDKWCNFLKACKLQVIPLENVTRLNEGTFLLHLNLGLYPLAVLVAQAKNFDIISRVLFFDQEIPWIISK